MQKVSLTACGERAFIGLREAAAAFDRRLHTGITDEQTTELRLLLTTISANIEAQPAPEATVR